MKVGEKRLIYIHPALAYGESGNVAPNLTLKVDVELIRVISQNNSSEFHLNEMEISTLCYRETEIRACYEKLKHQEAYQLGARAWSHFKLGQKEGYSLEAIAEALDQYAKNPPDKLTAREPDLLTHLHWKIYYDKE